MGPIVRTLAHGAAHKAGKRGLDLKLGIALARDPRVPAGKKVLALGVGLMLTALLIALEIPLEAVVAFFLPIVGEMIDLAIDGIEFVLLPLMFGALALPFLLPKHMVREIRRA